MAERPARQRNPTIKLTNKNQSLPPILSSHRENLASHALRHKEGLINASTAPLINTDAVDVDTPANPANKRASPIESDPGASSLPSTASKKTGNQKSMSTFINLFRSYN